MTEQSAWLSRALVGCVIRDPVCGETILRQIGVNDLDPPCDTLLSLLMQDQENAVPYNPHDLHRRVSAAYRGVSPTWLAEVAASGENAHLGYYLAEFSEGVARRRLFDAGDMLRVLSRGEDIRLGVVRAREVVDGVQALLHPTEVVLIDGAEVITYVAPPESVLIPQLLWRQGKVIVTGFEGQGKSVLLRQLVMAGALGIHPFKTAGRIEPIRTLYLDLENPKAIAMTEMRRMYETLVGRKRVPDEGFAGRLKMEFLTSGLDVLNSGRDREYLYRAVATHVPDLLVVGPIYRLAAGGGDLDEAGASRLINLLNELRATYDLAIATEAHPPHAQDGHNRVLRPSGSSAWMRFPEVGRGLRAHKGKTEAMGRMVYRLEDWRGDRTREMRFPDWVARPLGDQVWFDDVSEEVQATTPQLVTNEKGRP